MTMFMKIVVFLKSFVISLNLKNVVPLKNWAKEEWDHLMQFYQINNPLA